MDQVIFNIILPVFTLLPVVMATDGVDYSNMTRSQLLGALFGENSQNDPNIPPDYDKDVPTNVSVQMHIISFHSVNEVSMDFTMTFYLRRKWVDERLTFPTFTKFDILELDNRLGDQLWLPDIFFRNEKSASVHNVTVPNRLIHIHKNGTVLLSSRLSMTLSCPMNLLLFPLDVQACPIIIQSYTYSTSNVVFRWAEQSITMAEDWEMAHFQDKGIDTHPCTNDIFDGDFACVMATFRLQRHLGYFLVHVYLPTILVVILSWISFWIDAGATPARVTIGVMSVLTMTHESGMVQTVLPRVSYVKAIDVWMAACIIFVFAALLEFAYVNVLNRRKCLFYHVLWKVQKAGAPQPSNVTKIETVDVDTAQDLTFEGPDPKLVDKISRKAFPAAFVVFFITYLCVYGVLSWQQDSRTRRV